GGGDSDRDAEGDGQDDGRRRELHGGGEAPQQIGEYRVATDNRHPEVAADDLADIDAVLLPERAVEPEVGADLRHLLGRRALAEHGERRVPRNQMNETEDEDGDAEEDGDDSQATLDGVPPHRLILPGSRSATGPPPC